MPQEITKIRLNRGPEERRLSFTPELAEPIFITDTSKLYIGDGRTPGGILINSNNFDELKIKKKINFDNITGQRINLWTDEFGIGIQHSTLYFRSSNNFAWFLNGTHSDTKNDPGANGTKLMSLDYTGDLHINGALLSNGADLAEKYTIAPDNLLPGTVISVSENSSFDVEICSKELSKNIVGVISETAAIIMDPNISGTIIGLIGKVNVRIIGSIKKGDPIVSAGNGVARAIKNDDELLYKIGVSLETNTNIEEKIIRCIIK